MSVSSAEVTSLGELVIVLSNGTTTKSAPLIGPMVQKALRAPREFRVLKETKVIPEFRDHKGFQVRQDKWDLPVQMGHWNSWTRRTRWGVGEQCRGDFIGVNWWLSSQMEPSPNRSADGSNGSRRSFGCPGIQGLKGEKGDTGAQVFRV